jgi:antitoxin component YwqK of YwqJK toxin-antitoxin module
MATLTGCFVAFGQNNKKTVNKQSSTNKTEETRKDNLNKTDHQNRKQGLWFYKHEAAMGEPLTYEYGQYINNKKEGVWTTLDANQQLASTENYNKGVLNGTSQYYEQGRLICIGTYRGLDQDKKIDSVLVTNPDTYEDRLVGVPTDIGYTRHGLWRYYNAITGQLTKEEEYQVDDLVYRKEYHFASQTDSLKMIERSNKFLSKKSYYKPPSGKTRSLIE